MVASHPPPVEKQKGLEFLSNQLSLSTGPRGHRTGVVGWENSRLWSEWGNSRVLDERVEC